MISINNDPIKRLEARSYDLFKEPLTSLTSIRILLPSSNISLEEAVEPLLPLLPNLLAFVQLAKERCSKPANDLTVDESSSIMLYSMDWQPMDECLYYVLNATLRSNDRRTLKPWFSYLNLLFSALSRLPSQSLTVYRHVEMNLISQYPPEKRFPWWAFTFCTQSPNGSQSSDTRTEQNSHTRFTINCHSAKDIRKHLYFPDDDQILLMATSEFRVLSSTKHDDNHYSVHLEQLQSSGTLLQFVNQFNNDEILSAHVLMKISDESIQSRFKVETIEKYITRTTNLQKKIDQCALQSSIDLTNEHLDDRDISLIIQHALIKKQCSILRLDHNYVTVDGITMLAQSLEKNKTLVGLNLFSNRLFDTGVRPLAKLLSMNYSVLRKLHLGSNRISNNGVLLLADMLKTNTTLTVLWLDSNRITDEGVHFLANVLVHHNRTLQELSLKKNKCITSFSVPDFIDVFQHQQSLREVDVSNCGLTQEDDQRIRETIHKERQLILRCDDERDQCTIS